MWVLLLAVASFLAFLSITLLLWLADALETRARRLKRKYNVGSPFIVLAIAQAFEPVFALLWEAPIHALELVKAGGARGIPVSCLRPVFNEAAARFPEIYDGYGFEHWLQFLEDLHLVNWIGQQITLTHGGCEFLEYRFTTPLISCSSSVKCGR
jgi:hypothetical protein